MAKRSCKCIGLRNGSMVCAVLTVMYSMSCISGALNGLIYGDLSPTRQYLLISGLLSLFSSISCIHGVVRKSCYFLIPWIFVSAVTVIFGSVLSMTYIAYGNDYYIVIGIFILAMSFIFFIGWICVVAYFYQLCENDTVEEEPDRQTRAVRQSNIATERPFPPPYSTLYAEQYEDKPPSYDQLTQSDVPTNANASQQRY